MLVVILPFRNEKSSPALICMFLSHFKSGAAGLSAMYDVSPLGSFPGVICE